MKIVSVVRNETKRCLSALSYEVFVEGDNVQVKYERSLFGRWTTHRKDELTDSKELEEAFIEWTKNNTPTIKRLPK